MSVWNCGCAKQVSLLLRVTHTGSVSSIELGKWKDSVRCLRDVLVKLEILLANSIYRKSSILLTDLVVVGEKSVSLSRYNF